MDAANCQSLVDSAHSDPTDCDSANSSDPADCDSAHSDPADCNSAHSSDAADCECEQETEPEMVDVKSCECEEVEEEVGEEVEEEEESSSKKGSVKRKKSLRDSPVGKFILKLFKNRRDEE